MSSLVKPNHVVRYIILSISGNREAYTSQSQSKSNSRVSPVCGSACCLASYSTLSAQVRPWLKLSKGTICILRYPNISVVWFEMTLSSHVHTTGTDTCPHFHARSNGAWLYHANFCHITYFKIEFSFFIITTFLFWMWNVRNYFIMHEIYFHFLKDSRWEVSRHLKHAIRFGFFLILEARNAQFL